MELRYHKKINRKYYTSGNYVWQRVAIHHNVKGIVTHLQQWKNDELNGLEIEFKYKENVYNY